MPDDMNPPDLVIEAYGTVEPPAPPPDETPDPEDNEK